LGTVVAYAVNSPTFQLSEVKLLNVGTMTQEQAFQFCALRKGENLITLDLVSVQQAIRTRHPEFKEVVVRRVLPNRIEVLLKRRTPVAQVDYGRFIQVDRDLVILPGSSMTPFKNLTQIKGAMQPRQGLMVGVTLTDPMSKKALVLMDIVKRSNVLKNHTLTRIDITDHKNVVLIVDQSIEIRMGESHWMERLKILEQTLRAVEFSSAKIRYVDLRFDDVVIGPL
jgi:cell division septal protein FtsQ